jgi:hypothetical protein
MIYQIKSIHTAIGIRELEGVPNICNEAKMESEELTI